MQYKDIDETIPYLVGNYNRVAWILDREKRYESEYYNTYYPERVTHPVKRGEVGGRKAILILQAQDGNMNLHRPDYTLEQYRRGVSVPAGWNVIPVATRDVNSEFDLTAKTQREVTRIANAKRAHEASYESTRATNATFRINAVLGIGVRNFGANIQIGYKDLEKVVKALDSAYEVMPEPKFDPGETRY